MIGDRNVFIVRQQRIVGAEHPPGIGGVEDRGEEIGEIADLHRQREFRRRDRGQMVGDTLLRVNIGAAQELRQSGPQRRPGGRTERDEIVEMRDPAGGGSVPGRAVEQVGSRSDIEDLVPDGHPDMRSAGGAAAPERRIREVLDREIAAGHIGGGDEAFQRGIVGVIGGHGRGLVGRGELLGGAPGVVRMSAATSGADWRDRNKE